MSARGLKKLFFSCDTCRRRKVKCGQEQPRCHRCIARSDECVYKNHPTLTYTARLENRVKELEAQLAAARGEAAPASSGVGDGPSQTPSPGSPRQSSQSPSIDVSRGVEGQNHHDADAERSLKSVLSVKVNDSGDITYHGITSFFQLPIEQAVNPQAPSTSSQQTVQRRERLIANAWQQRVLENYSEIPDPFKYLLEVHWCWIQPLFNFIYRPAFTRDLQALGPYYSHALLNALLSYSLRWGRSDPSVREQLDLYYNGGALFTQHARSMVFDELISDSGPIPTTCSVPNVQALLMLSAQECSAGNHARAWVYSGIAFRITDHLGIYVDGERYPRSVQLTDEDTEIRHRLFWSCFVWDKFVSLYLGRLPRLRYSSVSPPQLILDDSSEIEPWVPFGIEEDDTGWKYPPTPAYSTTCFIQTCQLSVILSEILIHMYDPLRTNSWTEMQECLDAQDPKLRGWWENLPPHLKIDVGNLPPYAPPSHIVSLNATYHTIKILLYRPMLARPSKESEGNLKPMQQCLVECISSASSIISIFDLFCRTFGIRFCVLSLSYSVYIATSIFLLQVQTNSNDATALRRLEYCVRTLAQIQRIDPVIGSALDLIIQQLNDLDVDLTTEELPKQDGMPSMVPHGTPDPPPAPLDWTAALDENAENALEHFPFGDPVNPDDFTIDPAVFESIFETMASIEPLDIRVGAIENAQSENS